MGKKKKVSGAAAIPTIEEAPEAEKKPSLRTKTCPGCKATLANATRKCPQCGHMFGKKANASTSPEKPSRRGRPRKTADTTSDLIAASEFAKKVGGIQQAIDLLEVVKKIWR